MNHLIRPLDRNCRQIVTKTLAGGMMPRVHVECYPARAFFRFKKRSTDPSRLFPGSCRSHLFLPTYPLPSIFSSPPDVYCHATSKRRVPPSAVHLHLLKDTVQTLPSGSGPRFRPYACPNHHVTKGRYITSNDSRGYM
jgi:hypothetical protein